jgi:cation transport ATPase
MQKTILEPQWQGNEAQVYQMIKTVARRSQHPVSAMLAKQYHHIHGQEVDIYTYEDCPGLGLSADLAISNNRYKIAIGNLRFMHAQGVYLEGHTASLNGVVYVSINGRLAMRATYEDDLIPGVAELVHEMHMRGFQTYIMTGDTKTAACAVANRVGIPLDHVYHSLLPHNKASLIRSLERRFGPTVMVGDNLNDAPALAAATFGIVLSRAEDKEWSQQHVGASGLIRKFRNEADALIMPVKTTIVSSSGLENVMYILQLAQKTTQRMHQILQWSVAYNICALLMVSGSLNAVLPLNARGWIKISP